MIRWGRQARIHREASAWVIRMRGPDGHDLRDAFDAWRATSPDHDRHYQDAAWMMQRAAGARRTAPDRVIGNRPQAFRARAGVAVAALAGAATAGALYYDQHRDRFSAPPSEYASAALPSSVKLSDGSTMTLDPHSALRTHYDGHIRGIDLLSGSALFRVAHDAAHPFIVTAGDRQVTARGTVFRVTRTGSAISVVMVEGVVDVTHGGEPARQPLRLVRGQRLVSSGNRDHVSPAPDTASLSLNRPQPDRKVPASLATRDTDAIPAGMTRSYDATPLATLLADANTGAAKPIRLGTRGLSGLHVEGRFDIRDTRALAHILAAALELEVQDDGNSWVLIRA